ncbi:MAG: DUF5916 domain-containing protein [Pseudomonadota bacterium]
MNWRWARYSGWSFLLSFLFLSPVVAEIRVPEVTADIVLDGKLDEAFWADAVMVTLDYETRPAENTPAPVRTEVYLADNGEALLVGFRALDPEPDEIVAYLSDRDAAFNDDFVGIALDTFNDERRAFEFFVNPLGIQMDLTLDDINGNEDDSWNSIWGSAGSINAEGFVVEIEIPFRVLQFPAGDAEKTFGVDLLRFRPRENRLRLSNNIQDRDVPCYLCQLDKLVGFRNASAGRNLVIAPSMTAVRNDSIGDAVGTDAPLQSGDEAFEPALDITWGITPDVQLTATLNPDFSQVEADVAQLQINQQFALFFPERRPFFLEGADFFASPINAVFTRNVADPDYGLKITGKANGHTFGVFTANDTLTNLLLPGNQGSDLTSLDQASDIAVGRYAYDVGENSRLGALVTSRRGDDYRNTVVGFDGRFLFNDYNEIEFQVLDTSTRYPDAAVQDFGLDDDKASGLAYRVRASRNTRDWSFFAIQQRFDEGFRADLGFVPQVDYDRTIAGLYRTFYPEPGKWWNQIDIGGDWDITRTRDGQFLERELEMEVSIQAALRSYIEFGAADRTRAFDGVLYDETLVYTYAEMNPSGATFLGLFARTGDQIDFDNARLGKSTRISPRINQRFGDAWSIRLRHTWERLSHEGDDVFTVNLTDFRTQYQFNARAFLRLVLTHRDIERNVAKYIDPVEPASRSVSSQLLFSYKINPQTVFFLGYGDNRVEDDDFASLTQTDRSFFMKVGYAWVP